MTDKEAKELLKFNITRSQLKAFKPLLELKKVQEPEKMIGIVVDKKRGQTTFYLYYMNATKVIRVIER